MESGLRVSVALCTYNGSSYLAEQLESLLAQSHAPYELVAADDASSDDTWEILQHYAPRFARCRLIRNEQNLGLRTNFEQVFEACTGDWIAPCDQDDIWEADKLETLLQEARQGDMLVYCDSALIDGQGKPLHQKISDRLNMVSGSSPLAFAFANCVSGHACIFRTPLVELALPLPEHLYYDWWLAFVASSVASIRYVDRPLVRFRRHATTATELGREANRRVRRPPDQRRRESLAVLDTLASFPGAHQAALSRLAQLWRKSTNSWFTPQLAAFMATHYHALHAIDRKASRRSPAWQGVKFLMGIRLKMLWWTLRT